MQTTQLCVNSCVETGLAQSLPLNGFVVRSWMLPGPAKAHTWQLLVFGSKLNSALKRWGDESLGSLAKEPPFMWAMTGVQLLQPSTGTWGHWEHQMRSNKRWGHSSTPPWLLAASLPCSFTHPSVSTAWSQEKTFGPPITRKRAEKRGHLIQHHKPTPS